MVSTPREQIVYIALPAVKAEQPKQDSSTMSKSSDERIERHKQKLQQAADARVQQAQRAADEQQRRNQFLADLRAKWARDTHIIAEILKDIGPKLDGEFRFMDLGAPPHRMAASGRLTGRIGKQAPFSIDLTVDEDGRLHAAKSGHTNVLVVKDATREQYEEFILDLLDIEK
jgi:hypothetical protein